MCRMVKMTMCESAMMLDEEKSKYFCILHEDVRCQALDSLENLLHDGNGSEESRWGKERYQDCCSRIYFVGTEESHGLQEQKGKALNCRRWRARANVNKCTAVFTYRR